jgi:hypothetical protein
MTLGDVYVNKENGNIIQISCFARHLNQLGELIIIYDNVFNNGGMIGFAPSDCGYAKSKEEIEQYYDLLIPNGQDKNWVEVFELRDAYMEGNNK